MIDREHEGITAAKKVEQTLIWELNALESGPAAPH